MGRPLKLTFQPENWEDLLRHIPEDRAKPTKAGKRVVYVPHERGPCTWTHAEVVSITKTYKGTSWMVVPKPGDEDKYLAIGSENVFLE